MERAIYCTRVHLPELIKNYKYKGQDGEFYTVILINNF